MSYEYKSLRPRPCKKYENAGTESASQQNALFYIKFITTILMQW
jgi:hypothetical protein